MLTPAAPASSVLIACEHCGIVHQRHALQPGETALCSRCGTVLWKHSRMTLSGWLALTITALIVFAIANLHPVVSMKVQGMSRAATLIDALVLTWRHQYWGVAIMTGLAGFLIPLVQLLLLSWMLAFLAAGRRPPAFGYLSRLVRAVIPWSMVPVFLLGVLVAVVKLAGMASVAPEPGLWAFGVLCILQTILNRLDGAALWHEAEARGIVAALPHPPNGQDLAGCHACGQVQALASHDHAPACARCGAAMHHRKPEHLKRTWALLIAAAILYVPANVYPVMHIQSVFGDSAHTILGGVVELWELGSWDIATIVFIASVVVPLTKLVLLAMLAWYVQRRDPAYLRQRTRLYEIVEFIGQWSMLDVFVVILLTALAHFPGLSEISAGMGAGAFGMVVILTMLAAMSFDPRSGWDHAEPPGAPEADAACLEGRPAASTSFRKEHV